MIHLLSLPLFTGDLPLLIKAQGKCTTDHISQAGPWLKFRGHLDNISNNMFLGATNAFTRGTGTGNNPVSGEKDIEINKIARSLKDDGLGWIAVGDENIGEGSSREQNTSTSDGSFGNS